MHELGHVLDASAPECDVEILNDDGNVASSTGEYIHTHLEEVLEEPYLRYRVRSTEYLAEKIASAETTES